MFWNQQWQLKHLALHVRSPTSAYWAHNIKRRYSFYPISGMHKIPNFTRHLSKCAKYKRSVTLTPKLTSSILHWKKDSGITVLDSKDKPITKVGALNYVCLKWTREFLLDNSITDAVDCTQPMPFFKNQGLNIYTENKCTAVKHYCQKR